MRYIKGVSGNVNGRRKGVPNKSTLITNALLKYILEGGFNKFKTEFDKLKGKDYCMIYLQLCKFCPTDTDFVIVNKYLVEELNKKIKQNGITKGSNE